MGFLLVTSNITISDIAENANIETFTTKDFSINKMAILKIEADKA